MIWQRQREPEPAKGELKQGFVVVLDVLEDLVIYFEPLEKRGFENEGSEGVEVVAPDVEHVHPFGIECPPADEPGMAHQLTKTRFEGLVLGEALVLQLDVVVVAPEDLEHRANRSPRADAARDHGGGAHAEAHRDGEDHREQGGGERGQVGHDVKHEAQRHPERGVAPSTSPT